MFLTTNAVQTDRLLISDPKAIQHMYTSGYNIRKHPLRSEIVSIATGEGLAWADSESGQSSKFLHLIRSYAQTRSTGGSAESIPQHLGLRRPVPMYLFSLHTPT
jgi:hypothetical protein